MRSKWEEVGRKFTPPVDSTRSAKGDPLTVMKMAYGFTAVEMRHSRNGKIKFVEQVGDQR